MQNQTASLERAAGKAGDDIARHKAPLAAIAARRADLEARQAELDKLLPDFEKSAAKEKVAQARKTAAKVLGGAQRMARGAATIATAISHVTRPTDPESDEVQALKAQLLNGNEQYARLQDEVDEAAQEMSGALGSLMFCNQEVTTLSADFAGAIQTSIDLGRNRLSFSRGIDPGLKTSLVAMQRQAEHRLDLYLYLFRKAYMYEYGTVLDEDVPTVNAFIKRVDAWLNASRAALGELRKGAGQSAALEDISRLTELSDSGIDELGNDILHHLLGRLADKLLDRRRAQGRRGFNIIQLDVDKRAFAGLQSGARIELGRPVDMIANQREREGFARRNRLLKLTDIKLDHGALRFEAAQKPPRNRAEPCASCWSSVANSCSGTASAT